MFFRVCLDCQVDLESQENQAMRYDTVTYSIKTCTVLHTVMFYIEDNIAVFFRVLLERLVLMELLVQGSVHLLID